MVPRRMQELGYAYRHAELDAAIEDVLRKV
jgi:hypothetical protein